MSKPYYVLLTRDYAGDPWIVEFGDYSRSCVDEERDVVSEYLGKKNTKVIKVTTDSQTAIDHAVADLNAKGVL